MNDLGYSNIVQGTVDKGKIEDICEQLPCYPTNGSIVYVDGVALVKLSE